MVCVDSPLFQPGHGRGPGDARAVAVMHHALGRRLHVRQLVLVLFHLQHQTPSAHVNPRTTTRNWPFSVLGFWDKTPGFAPSPYHIAGVFRPLPGSMHSS